jgi:hypothetical protein
MSFVGKSGKFFRNYLVNCSFTLSFIYYERQLLVMRIGRLPPLR